MQALRVPTTLALAIVVLLLAGPAVAQAPPIPTNSGASVEIKAASPSLTVSLDSPVTNQLTVTNTGRPSGLPTDSPRRVVLEVTGVPDGWTAQVNPATFQLGPGQSAKSTLTVSVAALSLENQGTLKVTARMFPLGASSVPGAGPAVDPEATSATEIQLVRQDSPQRVLIESVGPYAWIFLLAIVAAVVVIATLLAANRRIAVRLSSDDTERSANPGGRAIFTVAVQNITRRSDSVVLRIKGVPEGWGGFLPTPQIDLEGGAREEISVIVIAPKEAEPGAKQSVTLTATSAQAPRKPATIQLEVGVQASLRRRATTPE